MTTEQKIIRRNDGIFDVLRHFFNTGFLRLISCNLQRQLATFVVQLLEAVETIAAVANHLAGSADVAELLGKLQQSDACP